MALRVTSPTLALPERRPKATRFSGAATIAQILDATSQSLPHLLISGSARNLSEAFQQLNPSEQNQLRERWGRSLDELISLSNERDATIFQHGLLEVGHRLEDADQLELASAVYSALVAGNAPRPPLTLRGGEGNIGANTTSSVSPSPLGGEGAHRADEGSALAGISTRAQARLNAISGVGDWQARLAFNLERLPSNATRWDMLLAMSGAGLVFRGVRLAATARWASSFESAFALNAAATSTAFLSETAAFTGLGRLFGTMAGNHYDWSATGTFNEWAGGAAMLLGLKAMGGVFGNLSERWAAGETAFARVTRAVAPQAGMFSGIVLGNRLAELGAFHPERHGDTWLVDGLTTLLEFNIAGRLQRSAGGPGLTNLEGRMEAYTRTLGKGNRRRWGEVFSAAMVTPEGIRIPAAEAADDTARPLEISAVYSIQHEEKSGPLADRPDSARYEQPKEERSTRSSLQIFPLLEIDRKIVFSKAFDSTLDGLAPHVLLLDIFTDYQGLDRPLSPTENGLQELRFAFSRTLYDSRTLGEIRVHLGDGTMMWVARNAQGRMLYGYETQKLAREVQRARVYPTERTQAFFLLAPKAAEEIEQSLWSRVFNVLRERSGLSRQSVADRLNEMTASKSDAYTIAKIENHGTDALQFNRLQALAHIFGVPTGDLVQVLNLSRHHMGLYEGIRPQDWETASYPIYLETPADLERLRWYREHDPKRESLSWLIYSARKNPDAYLNLPELSETTGIAIETLSRLEQGHAHYLTRSNFGKLAETLGIALYRVLRAANQSYYPDLPIADLFPGQALYLDPDSDDVAKIQSYLANPGSPGEYLFRIRQDQEGFPSAFALSRHLNRRINFWGDREWNRVAFDTKTWRDWVEVLSILDRPLAPLAKHLKRLGLRPESPEVLLTYALAGESLLDFNQRSGIAPRTIANVMLPKKGRSEAILQPETILGLQRCLPRLRGDLLYDSMYPEIRGIFDPYDAKNPVLHFDPNQITAARDLHLGERLFAYRMDLDLELLEMGKKIGMSREDVFRHESRVVDTLDPEVMAGVVQVLNIDPRLLYTHYHPEILSLFRVQESPRGPAAPLSVEAYRQWIAGKELRRDPSNRRDQLVMAMEARGLKTSSDLAQFMRVSAGDAEKFLKSSRSLSTEEIQNITRAFPELSYQSWYEHFNAPALAYFLGSTPEGRIDYSIPGGMSLETFEHFNLAKQVRDQIQSRFSSVHEAISSTGISFLDSPETLRSTVARRTWEDLTMARIARGLGIDRRLIYMIMKLPELRPMLEGKGASPPPDTRTPLPKAMRSPKPR